MSLVTKIFGTHSQREVKKILPIVDKIEALSDKYSAMSEAELRGITEVLKNRLADGETLDDILPDAYAAVREASWRVLGKRHYRVQLIGGVILHQGRIAEMKTGEGKTLMATLPAYLNALTGKGVHIVTVNDYLARRDSEWMGKVYNYLGLSVGLIVHGVDNADRRKSYSADITYGTNNEFGFDYLRDNMVAYKNDMVQRGHIFAIVDEVDSILIDEARTPLIISGMAGKSTDLYTKVDKFVRTLSVFKVKELDDKEENDRMDGDYIVDEKANSVVLTAEGIRKAEEYFGIENLADTENITLSHHINQAIRAHGVMQNDIDYVVKDGEVLIVDSFTGRIMQGRRYSNGLHQAIEAKEGVTIKNESRTLATITFQNYFRMYGKLSGMTGTALTEEEEFREIYGLDVVEIPTNRPMIRKDLPDSVFISEKGKLMAVLRQIKECNDRGQPILVGTVSIEKSELLSALLNKNGIKHTVLNAKFHEKEAEIVAQAGKLGAVTISTNMAGRGTDIMLGGNPEFMAKNAMRRDGHTEEEINAATSYFVTADEEILALREKYNGYLADFEKEIAPEAKKVQEAGGLFILGTERHESRRIDNQLRGRSGRQGDPGASRFCLSLEDDLMRLFGSERVINMVKALGIDEDTPIDAKILSNSIESAQKRLEGDNFQRRKNVLMYDDVMNQQREKIYGERREVLEGTDIKDKIIRMIEQYVLSTVDTYLVGDIPDYWNFDSLRAAFLGYLTTEDDFRYKTSDFDRLTKKEIEDELLSRVAKVYQEKEELFPDGRLRDVERAILLRSVDEAWVEHITAMDDLRGSIGLRAYAQTNPIVAYRREGADMFDEMITVIREETAKRLLAAVPVNRVERLDMSKTIIGQKQAEQPKSADMGVYGSAAKPEAAKTPVRVTKVGRNDPCPCGSGKKYKKCCGAGLDEAQS